jgi:hypothetical protein
MEKSFPHTPPGLQQPGSVMPATDIVVDGQLASMLPGWFRSTQPGGSGTMPATCDMSEPHMEGFDDGQQGGNVKPPAVVGVHSDVPQITPGKPPVPPIPPLPPTPQKPQPVCETSRTQVSSHKLLQQYVSKEQTHEATPESWQPANECA